VNRQIRRLGITLGLLFTALFVNLNYIQVVQADKLAHDPRNGRIAFRDFNRARGQILSADGAVLARSVPSSDQFKLLRQYPENQLFAHLTGFFSFTYGSEGVERQYNDDLAAHRARNVTNLRQILTAGEHPANVTLTVSKQLQQVARDRLGTRKGAVVALDPRSGAVLALWSYPSYDPNPLAAHDQQAVRASYDSFTKDANEPLLPRAYRRSYFPGSTFKVVTSSAVLDKAPELATRSYPQLRQLALPQTTSPLSNFGGEQCGGVLPDLLRVSCNTGFAQIGLDLGADKLVGEAQGFGFSARPPLDLPAAAASSFPATSAFAHDKPALAKSAIGQQDVQATPLEMALVASAIANGGMIMKPHVLGEIRDDQGNVVRTAEPQPWMRATSPETAAQVRDFMVGVVQGGTATGAAIPGVQVAAKTGTAQTTGDNAHAWLVAFAPAAAPTVAVAVIVESQPGLGDNVTGGRVAAPIAKAVLQAALGRP
jgi:peptidoglycan glycosyltransferase